jgi:2-C-methyl-D-erythritol 4-phosphate cytidylyltransferase
VSRLRDALAKSPDAKRFVIHSSETGTPSHLVGEGQGGGLDISVVAVAVRDTCKEVIDGMIRRTVARDTLNELVGPWQMTREALAQAVRNAAGHESDITDLVGLTEATGLRVRVLQAG